MAQQFAGRLALIAFAAACLQGALSLADFEGAIKAALAASALFYGLGILVGDLGRRIAEEGAKAEFARLAAAPESRADSPKK